MYQQLWGYKVEEKLYMGGVLEQKRLNTTALEHPTGKNLMVLGRVILVDTPLSPFSNST
jgi:hypothetical protein